MGLDITAYRQIEKTEDETDFHAYRNQGFPGRADDVEEGYHEYADSEGFRAGSYSGYNQWRNELARIAGYPPSPGYDAGAWAATEGPFWELINFADNEGVIGAAVSAKLAKDFAEFQSKADEVGGSFKDRYDLWRKAFEMAADRGAVQFH